MPDGTTITVNAQDTAFSRHGKTVQYITHQGLPGNIPLEGVVGRGPGPITRTSVVPAFPQYLGPLGDIAARLPFNTTLETATTDLYVRVFAIARALAQSGPVNVRGGTARQGFELAELSTQQSINRFKEVWASQLAEAQVVIAAAQLVNAIYRDREKVLLTDSEQDVMAKHANAQQAMAFLGQINAFNQNLIQQYSATQHYGTSQMITDEDLDGSGTQPGIVGTFGSSSWR